MSRFMQTLLALALSSLPVGVAYSADALDHTIGVAAGLATDRVAMPNTATRAVPADAPRRALDLQPPDLRSVQNLQFASGSRSASYPPQQFDPTALAVILGAASVAFLLATLLISAYETLHARRLEPQVEKLGRAVEHASEEIRDLSRRLVEPQDAEKRRLATELHDIVGQNLSALVTELALIRSRVPAARQPDLDKGLADAMLLAKQSVEAVRKVMAQLRPPGLDELGLPAALRWHANAFESRTSIATRVDSDESLPRPVAAVENALLRIYLEALTNIAKHASAHSVLVKLELRNEHIRLSVADDGRGFDVQGRVRGETERWGLAIMRERAVAVGGELYIRSTPGAGSFIEFCISKSRWSYLS